MAKTCPSCGYNEIGPFTDNCPLCAEPVRHVRSDPSGAGRPSNLSPWQRWVMGGAVVVALVGIWYWAVGGRGGPGVKDFDNAIDRAQAETAAQRRSRTVVVAVEELLQEFQDDAAADRKYRGKYLVISGVVERAGMDGDDTPFVILHGGDDHAPLRIECFFDDADDEDEIRIGRLGKGQTITVRGEYNGRVSHVQVRECVLVR